MIYHITKKQKTNPLRIENFRSDFFKKIKKTKDLFFINYYKHIKIAIVNEYLNEKTKLNYKKFFVF